MRWPSVRATGGLSPFRFGFALSASAIPGFVLTGFVSSIESIGDVEAICEGTAGRPATDAERKGAVLLILCGLVPKIGAVVTTIPIAVLPRGTADEEPAHSPVATE